MARDTWVAVTRYVQDGHDSYDYVKYRYQGCCGYCNHLSDRAGFPSRVRVREHGIVQVRVELVSLLPVLL